MKVAALDLGTNSFLCLIAEVSDNKIIKVIEDHSKVVRLGQDVNRDKRLHPEALKRARACLTEFRQRIDANKVDKVMAVATSAVRDSENRDEFYQIGKDLNIPIQVIDGDAEAKMTFLGAFAGFPIEGQVVVIDVGGGSTEIILGNENGPLIGESVNAGCVRLTEMFSVGGLTTDASVVDMHDFANRWMAPICNKIKTKDFSKVVAVAGTPTTLAAMDLGGFDAAKVNGFKLSQERLQAWIDELVPMSTEEKVEKYKIDEGRADVLIAGCVLLLEGLRLLGEDELTVSTQGVRYGLALEMSRS